MFKEAKTVQEVLGMLVGACSSTRFWDAMPEEYPTGAGVFCDEVARRLVDEVSAALAPMLLELLMADPKAVLKVLDGMSRA